MNKIIWLDSSDLTDWGFSHKENPRLEDFKNNLKSFEKCGLVIYERDNGNLIVLKSRSNRMIKKLNLNIEYTSHETMNFSYDNERIKNERQN